MIQDAQAKATGIDGDGKFCHASRRPTRRCAKEEPAMGLGVHALRQPTAPIEELVREHGRAAVVDEIDEMIHHDMAEWALTHAIALRHEPLIRSAATVVNNSGSYSAEAKALARQKLDAG